MSAISDDILVDIFARLPARSICALRCVCKSWLNIITHPSFVKIHHDYAIHKNKSSLLLINNLDKRIYSVVDYEASLRTAAAFVVDYPFKSPDYGVQFWATCNGLLCMATGKDIICIWNPSTQEYKKIELMNTSVNEEYALSGTFRYGLGYDSNIDDYKLVRILGYYDNAITPRWILKLRDPIYRDDGCGVEVYTLGTNSSKCIPSCFPYAFCCQSSTSVFYRGGLHWIAEKNWKGRNYKPKIVSFDVSNETFEVPLLQHLDRELDLPVEDISLNLSVWRGQLCLHVHYAWKRSELWVMQDYGVVESWTKLVSITEETIAQSNKLRPIQYFSNGEILFEKNNLTLVLYDPKLEKPSYPAAEKLFKAERYVTNLVSLNTRTFVGQEQKQKKKRKRHADLEMS